MSTDWNEEPVVRAKLQEAGEKRVRKDYSCEK